MSSLVYPHRNLTGWRFFKQYGYCRLKKLANENIPGWNVVLLVDALIRNTLGNQIDSRLEKDLQLFVVKNYDIEPIESKSRVRQEFVELRDGYIESLEQCPGASNELRRYWASACMACRGVIDAFDFSHYAKMVEPVFLWLEMMGYDWFLHEKEHGVVTRNQSKAIMSLATKRYQHLFKKTIRCQFNASLDMSDKHNIEVVKKWQKQNDGLLHRMALKIWKENEYDEMPVFADALRESECDDRWFIDHATSDCRHRKGCWLIDTFAAIY